VRAAVVHSTDEPLRVEDVPKPEAGPGNVIVKIETCGPCHTDIHAARGDWPIERTPPFISGHEGARIVERVGSGVTRVVEGEMHCVADRESLRSR